MNRPPPPTDFNFIDRALMGLAFGAVLGLLMVGVGFARAIVPLLSTRGAPLNAHDIGFFALYVGGFAVAGAVLGVLWPLHSTPLGAYSLGYIGTAIVITAIVLIEMEMEPRRDLGSHIVGGIIMTVVFGTAAGYQIRRNS